MAAQRQPLNTLVCNALVSACASAGRWRLALAFLEEMASLSLEMDIFSWSCAIDACEKGGEWQRALHLCNRLHEMHLAPNVVAMSSAMSACAKASRWEISLLLLGSMSEFRVQRIPLASVRSWPAAKNWAAGIKHCIFFAACLMLPWSLML